MAVASFSTATPTLSRYLFKLNAGSSAALASALPPRPSLQGFQRWRRVSGIVRAEEKAKNAAFPSSPVPGKDRGDYEELTSGSRDCDPLCSLDEVSSRDFEESYQPKTDLVKALSILAATLAGAAAINHSWVASNQDLAMVLVFSIGYAGIIFEESLAFNKSGVGLLMAVCLWVIRSIGAPSTEIAVSELNHASGEVSEIVFFLFGAMTIVEIVDAHRGFKLITDSITTRKPRTLLWVVGFVTFFVSSVLDNLTSTIIMVSLLRKLVPPSEYRKLLGAVIVIAANAGGAWTPIGDVTTTMLWINGQISTLHTMQDLFVPSAISLAVPLALMSLTSEVSGTSEKGANILASEKMAPRGQLVFAVGIGALLFVPVFKAITGLPPYIGMLLGLGVLWILTDAIHYGDNGRQKLKVPQALSRIDTQGVLFFLGILLSVSSLESAGVLRNLANYLDAHIPNVELIASAIGVVSAIIDNVPLVAATMGMYNLTSFPQDSEFWQLVAFCAGTGGSMLIIGSAAGVAYMGMEKVDFFWYLRKVSGFAFAGYTAGIVAYVAAHNLHLTLPTSMAELPFLSGF
ncbi:sodium/proton antiporter 2-like [Zingiber officinale]|uniref:sodium/proton antiporter 2-like n=1 Tax=Zingiber officinale TaxID=94328 RepID=UPI001C4D8A7D|nr:sodium/proton antiporter 2-like [Zingiber officinale]